MFAAAKYCAGVMQLVEKVDVVVVDVGLVGTPRPVTKIRTVVVPFVALLVLELTE